MHLSRVSVELAVLQYKSTHIAFEASQVKSCRLWQPKDECTEPAPIRLDWLIGQERPYPEPTLLLTLRCATMPLTVAWPGEITMKNVLALKVHPLPRLMHVRSRWSALKGLVEMEGDMVILLDGCKLQSKCS